ncbi:pitrilysin family protein [uncultured Piscinibacter sp.]|uniref:M16 family metallopeptidase n=1 Tax=uncultured Piscinibacter sp. TaxID=1131835 RepID=UPI002626769B|nr:pitrilysin family protein [uncultured Piscinibacter sp.]
MLRLLRGLVLLFVSLQLGLAQAQALPAGVRAVTSVEGIAEYRLDNGLQLLLVADDSKPTTTVNLTYHVGSRHENYGETGMAHLLEHLIFKGTPKHPKVWAEFEKRGLRANGSTSFDRTNYTASFSADEGNLDWYIGWLADSMVNSFIARRDLDTEMTVVRNEMEMGENSPQRILYQRTLALMYDWHNYGKDVIGARSDVENVDIGRLKAFYRNYYQPDNATLIVSGSFVTQRVLQRVAATFGRLPKPKRVLPGQYTLDPAQDGERSVTLRRVGGAPLIFAGYHMPPAGDPDAAAADLLALVLGDAPSGRLHKSLTEKQLAAATFGESFDLAEPSVLLLGAQLPPASTPDAARAAMLGTIESFAAEPLTETELERARAKWLKHWEQTFSNPEAVGMVLSESVAQGDWRMFFLARDRVREATLADVQRVATQRLVADNRTVATYLPTEKPLRAPAPRRVDMAEVMRDFKPAQAAAKVEAFAATPANIDARTKRFEVGGLRAAVVPKGTRGQAVRAVLTLRFGDAATLAGLGEVPDFTAALLDKGTATMTREQVQDRLDQLKTEMAFRASPGQVRVTISSRRPHLSAAIALAGELLRRPAFPAEAFGELQRQALTSIESQRKEPDALAENVLARIGNPYPRGDVRYARTFDEMVEDVNAVSLEKVRDFHTRFYGAARGEFAAAGDLDVAEVRAALQSAFGDWRAGADYTRVPRPFVAVAPQRLVLATPDKQNATMLARLPLPLSDRDADYPALAMANYLLGLGGNSRLWKRIREKEGLSYDVNSRVSWNPHEPHSVWLASAIFAPQNGAKVEQAFREELARALRDGFTAQELAEGQRGLLNFRRLSRAQDGSMAATLASNLDLDRSYAHAAKIDAAIAKLTLSQVNAALRKYLKPDDFVVVLAGDFKQP